MRMERQFRERCALRGLAGEALERAVAAAGELAILLDSRDPDRGPVRAAAPLVSPAAAPAGTPTASSTGPTTASRPEGTVRDIVERHVARLLGEGRSDPGTLLALARYCAVIGETDAAVRLLAVLSPIGVLEAHAARLGELEGPGVAERVTENLPIPPPGSPPEAYPPATAEFMRRLAAELPPERVRRVLCWNVHGIPDTAFEEEKARFAELGSIDAWLEDRHLREVAVLERHAADGTLWFEQRITPRVVDFVRGDQEILAGRREGDRIYATKIPYDPDRWLVETDPVTRRVLACHCPLAAASIREGRNEAPVPSAWCDCSGGFVKQLFDVVFGEETEAELLESVLAGDDRCRFAVVVPGRFRTAALQD